MSLIQVKIWFQNRRTKWKKQENISNAEAAEYKIRGDRNQQAASLPGQQQHTYRDGSNTSSDSKACMAADLNSSHSRCSSRISSVDTSGPPTPSTDRELHTLCFRSVENNFHEIVSKSIHGLGPCEEQDGGSDDLLEGQLRSKSRHPFVTDVISNHDDRLQSGDILQTSNVTRVTETSTSQPNKHPAPNTSAPDRRGVTGRIEEGSRKTDCK